MNKMKVVSCVLMCVVCASVGARGDLILNPVDAKFIQDSTPQPSPVGSWTSDLGNYMQVGDFSNNGMRRSTIIFELPAISSANLTNAVLNFFYGYKTGTLFSDMDIVVYSDTNGVVDVSDYDNTTDAVVFDSVLTTNSAASTGYQLSDSIFLTAVKDALDRGDSYIAVRFQTEVYVSDEDGATDMYNIGAPANATDYIRPTLELGTTIPEPSSVSMVVMSGAGLLFLRRYLRF